MAYKILVLGASYGSLLGTKLLMAGHDVTLVCRPQTAQLINAEGTTVRLKLKGEEAHREIRSAEMPPQLNPGRLDATPPEAADPAAYNPAALALQDPHNPCQPLRTPMVRGGGVLLRGPLAARGPPATPGHARAHPP